MNDSYAGNKEDNNKNKNITKEESNNKVEDVTTTDIEKVEEVVIEEELEDVKTYDEVNTVPVDPMFMMD